MRRARARGLVALAVSGFLPAAAHAADRTVPGQYPTIQACATAAATGDRCLVSPGIYPEHVSTVRPGVTFTALGPVTMQGFRIRHANITLDGFDITHYAVGLDQAHIRVEPEADACRIVNNVIRDGIYLSSAGFVFDGLARTITNPAGGFVAAGFVPGASLYITSDINTQILNHDNNGAVPYRYETKVIKAVTDTTLTLVDTNTLFTEGPVPSTIYVNSAEKNGMWGILFISSTQRGAPDRCRITGNRFSNLAGKAIAINGNDHTVEGNTFERMNGWRVYTFTGHRNVFRRNIIRHSPRWPGFSLPKTTLAALGSGSWDMYDVLFASQPFGELTNDNIIEENWIEDVDAQFSNITESGSRGLIVRRNVFINYEMQGGLSRPGTQVVHNTFLRAARLSPFSFVLAKSTIGGNPIDSAVQHNAFVASGPPSIMGFDGTPTAGVTVSHNFLTGDPGLRDPSNPLGPDGVPFTLDDGVKPRPGSPVCGAGLGGVDLGAYSCDPLIVFVEAVPRPATPQGFRVGPE